MGNRPHKGINNEEAIFLRLEVIHACTLCKTELPLAPRPFCQLHPKASTLIAAQAEKMKVHETGMSFNDPSEDRLGKCLGVDRNIFYDAQTIAILSMEFCYLGMGKPGGLLPSLPHNPGCTAT